MWKRKCADVGPMHAGDSRGRGQNTNTTGNNVASGGQCTQGRDSIAGPTHGADGRKSHATQYSCGRQRNWESDRESGRTGIRSAAMYGEGDYGIVRAD